MSPKRQEPKEIATNRPLPIVALGRSAIEHRRRGKESEFRSYAWIVKCLGDIGWNTRNPNRDPAGQVFTQHECNADPWLRAQLAGGVPENVVKVQEGVYWIIEAKPTHRQLDLALREAEDYAAKINEKKTICARFVTGVAGNDTEGYLARTEYWDGKEFRQVCMNGHPITSLLSPRLAKDVASSKNPNLQDVQVDKKLFMATAEKINGILHNGGINLKARAQVLSALLLAMLGDPLNLDTSPLVLIGDINHRAQNVLTNHGKSEYAPHVALKLPATTDNHTRYKAALIKTINELRNLNIRSAMESGTDVLGEFYEAFLKYGNGAKEIGIVLTPRHITTFAAKVMGITAQDVVYDPCCGTGGFLVAAYDQARRTGDVAEFKNHRIFGVDQEAEVVTLAIVNMIFRGDGKTNIIEGSCFKKHVIRNDMGRGEYTNAKLDSADKRIVTKVLMNPPFPTSGGQEPEYHFVDAALEQLQDKGLLFSVLPYPTLVKSGAHKSWRKKLLSGHTLLAVITFPPDLFYPTSTGNVLNCL